MSERRQIWMCLLLLAVVTLASFGSSLDNGFVNWDDPKYIINNPQIKDLSWDKLKSIFSSGPMTSYVPLTLLSLSLDHAIWGMNPTGYHLTNLLFHVANTWLVFVIVMRLSGQLWPALVSALLFGVHPLHVESVAWVTERKDVLSAFFFLGAVIFYLDYLRERKTVAYVLSIGALFLSLLSKSMGVTLPFVLLLCDYLLSRKKDWQMLLDKIPFLALSLVFGMMEILARRSSGITEGTGLSLGDNLLIGIRNLAFYLTKTVVPTGLSAYYPYPSKINIWQPDFFLSLILVVTLAALVWRLRRMRHIVFGSLFFVLTLLPVLKILPFGSGGTIAADRYMYIPSIGLFYLIGLPFSLMHNRQSPQWARNTVILVALLGCGILTSSWLTWHRGEVWQDEETLWRDVLEKYPYAPAAHTNLAATLEGKGQVDAAFNGYRRALALNPRYAKALSGLGSIYKKKGDAEAATALFRKALSINPNLPGVRTYLAGVHNNLAVIHRARGELDSAIREYNNALSLDSSLVDPHYNLGNLYVMSGRLDAAIAAYQKALALEPAHVAANLNLGVALQRKGMLKAALAQYERVVSLSPSNAGAHHNAGKIQQATGNLKRAIFHFNEAVRIAPNERAFYFSLASALHSGGQKAAAISVLKELLARFPRESAAAQLMKQWQG